MAWEVDGVLNQPDIGWHSSWRAGSSPASRPLHGVHGGEGACVGPSWHTELGATNWLAWLPQVLEHTEANATTYRGSLGPTGDGKGQPCWPVNGTSCGAPSIDSWTMNASIASTTANLSGVSSNSPFVAAGGTRHAQPSSSPFQLSHPVLDEHLCVHCGVLGSA